MNNNEKVRCAIYCRVSLADKKQDINLQLNELKQYTQARQWEAFEYLDNGVSGANNNRPALNQLMRDAKARKFDLVLVWKLDRFGRSLKHLLNTLDEFKALGISFVSLRDSIDLTTPTGQLMFSIIGAFAEFERNLIIERVKAGMLNAKLKGVRIGRTPTPPPVIAKVISVFETDKSGARDISKKTGVAKSTVFRILQDYKAGKINHNGLPIVGPKYL
jgi:DNA invertase Pin-like site-specific DNA recombinase